MAENKDKKVLNVPNKRELTPNKFDSVEHKEVRLKRNVPNLRFKEFSGEWEEKRLGEIMNFSEKRINASTLTTSNYISTENMLQDFQGVIEAKSVPNNTNVISFTYGDILISNIRPYLKKVWKASIDGGCSSDVLVMKANDKINNDYLHYVIANNRFINFVMNGAKGVKMPRGDKEQMKTYIISLPPMVKEQRKIATFLSLLDERIATQNKIIEELKQLKNGIINHTFNSLKTKCTPFKNLYKDAGEGGTPSTSNASYYDNGTIPFIKIDDLKKKYLTCNKDYITNLGLQKSSAWLIPTNSILFSNGATIGEISITTYSVTTKQGILGIVPNSDVDTEYLYYLMSSQFFKKAINRIITEGTMKTAYLKDINKIICPLPSKEVQKNIARLPSILNRKIEIEQSLLDKFLTQKQHLLRQMFI